jgi:hypothetical protein
MSIDNKPETKEEPAPGDTRSGLFGPPHGTQLVSAISLRTNDSRNAQFIIVRELAF